MISTADDFLKTAAAPLAEAEGSAVPAGGEAFWFDARDGARLRGAVWRDGETARGTVLVLHGRTEFIEKYYEVIGELLARGFAVATMDWRGQGLSVRETGNPLKGHVRRFADFEGDLAAFLGVIGTRGLPMPLVALAHSMGGHVLLRWLYRQASHDVAARGLPEISAAALSAPMIALNMSPAANLLMRALCFGADALSLGERYIPGGSNAQATGAEAFADNIVTSDPERHARVAALVAADPRLALAAPTCAWGAAAADSMDEMLRPGVPEAIDVPVLIAGAENDLLVDAAAMPAYTARLPKGRYLAVPEARHEILMERDPVRTPFWGAFDALAAEVAPARSGGA